MARTDRNPSDAPQRIPWAQALFDDIFLLFLLGILVPTLLYIVWGLMNLAHVPLLPR